MSDPHILVLDQGTTSTRAILFNRAGGILCTARRELKQYYPASGQVEHDADEIVAGALAVCGEVIAFAERNNFPVAALGLTNQRETTVVWDRKDGRPLHRAIVWQDRRTADACEDLRAQGIEADVSARTGLLIDSYFSATKIAWILDHVDGARQRAERGELAFGTTDCYLLWRLSGGRVHATDATNASRTLLLNIHSGEWDDVLLGYFNVPREMLPQVNDCAADYGNVSLPGATLPLCGVAGDQQAAAIGQACFHPGMVKSTYGTGCFVLMHTGEKPAQSQNRLISTIAWRLNGDVRYALEGSIFNAGSAIQWLRDELGLIASAQDSERMARQSESNRGVYLVPAFTGLGAPHWDANARGGIFGLVRDTTAADLVRAALESVCYQTWDLLEAMACDAGRPEAVRVDGGMSVNNWLMQFLADILQLPVERPQTVETTALGAAFLAGLQCGVYADLDEISECHTLQQRFTPAMSEPQRAARCKSWRRAVRRTRSGD